jgi:hypothetical protein
MHIIIGRHRSFLAALGDRVHLIAEAVTRLQQRLFQACPGGRSLVANGICGAVQKILGVVDE